MAAARHGSDYYVDPTLRFRRGSASSSRSNPFESANRSVFADDQDADPDSELRIDTRSFAMTHANVADIKGEGTVGSRRGSSIYDGNGERRDSWREDAKKSPVNRRPSWRDENAFLNRPSPDQRGGGIPHFRAAVQQHQHLQRFTSPFAEEDTTMQAGPSASRKYHSNMGDRFKSPTPSREGSPGPKGSPRRAIPTADAMSIRKAPRASYLNTAEKASKAIAKDTKAPRKLLLLDLNGTLLYRKTKTREGSAKPTPRPFLKAFLEYCLGPVEGSREGSSDETLPTSPGTTEATVLGTHFHSLRVSSPSPNTAETSKPIDASDSRSQGAYELIVWSSAQPANVDSMLVATLLPEQRERLLRVWARNTLVPQRFFWEKAQTTKDLEIVWHALNLQSDERLLADQRDAADAAAPDDSAADGLGAAGKAALEAGKAGPWNATNTLLLDDTADKARLQPFNHLLVTEFGLEEVEAIDKLRKKLRKDPDIKSSKLMALTRPLLSKGEKTGEDDAKILEKQHRIIEQHDNLLLQTIGVLEQLRGQDNVASFIKSGGIDGYGAAAHGLPENATEAEISRASHWIQQGLDALAKAGIKTSLAEEYAL